MFILSVKNRNGNKIELYKTRSQVEMDKFTTCFSSKEALLKKLELENCNIIVEKYNNTNECKVEIPFTDSRYRNVIYNFNNDEYLKQISSMKDKYSVKLYFLNELLRFEKELSYYETNRYLTLNKIIELFETSDKSNFQNNILFNYMRNYFNDNYGYFKDFYMYMINFTKKEVPIYDTNAKDEVFTVLRGMKQVLNGKDINVEPNINQSIPYNVHELEFNRIMQNDNDNDEKIDEMNMFVDEYKTKEIEELSKKFINKL